jgi:hypothetical protein
MERSFFDNAIYQLWSDSFTLNGNSVTFYSNFGHTAGPTLNFIFIDNVASSPKATTAIFTSSAIDDTFNSSTLQIQGAGPLHPMSMRWALFIRRALGEPIPRF